MSVGLRSRVDSRPFRSRSTSISYLPGGFSSVHALAPRPTEEVGDRPEVRVLPKPQPQPLWLRSLLVAQKGTSILAFVLGAVALTAYGQMVFAQKTWDQQYHTLLKLQRSERQLTGAIQGLKDQLAREAERPEMGLVYPNPANAIFLTPAPLRTSEQVKGEPPEKDETSFSSNPLGY